MTPARLELVMTEPVEDDHDNVLGGGDTESLAICLGVSSLNDVSGTYSGQRRGQHRSQLLATVVRQRESGASEPFGRTHS
jgi:hypothetical protein